MGWDRVEYVYAFVDLEARQLLMLFAPVYYSCKINSDDVIITGVLYLHANVHKAGQITGNN
jgi:hypothetical protein